MSELAAAPAAGKAAAPAPALADLPALEERLRRAWERGRAAAPDLQLDATAFARHLARCLARDGYASAALDGLMVEDLYLAAACLEGLARAVELFRQRYRGPIRTAVRKLGGTPSVQDDVEQQLYDTLLVGADGPPRLRLYGGKGTLARWLSVAAQRAALMLMRSDRAEARARDRAASEALDLLSPEMVYLKDRHRAEFQAATEEALAKLAHRDRIVLRLHLVSALSVEAIGKMYGVSQSTASRWLAHAREAVASEVHRSLSARLQLTPDELRSMAALVMSQLDLSLSQLLRTASVVR